jgi:hypothetical protein
MNTSIWIHTQLFKLNADQMQIRIRNHNQRKMIGTGKRYRTEET